MTLGEMQREFNAIVQDASAEILVSTVDYINEAVQQIAEEVNFPELKQVVAVITNPDAYYVNMPVAFSGRLKYAGNSSGKHKILDGGIDEMLEWYPSLDEQGNIIHVALDGKLLYYHPVPAEATVITCVGYAVPPLLVHELDTPSFIPDYLHREAIVNKAASIAYNTIEDGLVGEKVNTLVFAGLAEVGLNKLRAYVSRRRCVVGKSIWSV